MTIPRLLGGALNDLRTIAEGMAVLPQLLSSLNGIQGRVDSLDDEVKRMRAAVDGMGGDVGELRDGIERLEPHLEDVTRVAHPLRRLGDRRRGRAEGLMPRSRDALALCTATLALAACGGGDATDDIDHHDDQRPRAAAEGDSRPAAQPPARVEALRQRARRVRPAPAAGVEAQHARRARP